MAADKKRFECIFGGLIGSREIRSLIVQVHNQQEISLFWGLFVYADEHTIFDTFSRQIWTEKGVRLGTIVWAQRRSETAALLFKLKFESKADQP